MTLIFGGTEATGHVSNTMPLCGQGKPLKPTLVLLRREGHLEYYSPAQV